MPIIFSLSGLSADMLVQILKEPKNAILKQYQKLLALDEVKLEFEDGALEAIRRDGNGKAYRSQSPSGYSGGFMLDIMYEIPKDDSIGQVIITKEYIQHTGGPRILLRGQELPMLEVNR